MTTKGENISLSLHTRSKTQVAKEERINRLERHAKVAREYMRPQ